MKLFALPATALAVIIGLAVAGPIQQRIENDNQHARTQQLIAEQRELFAG